MKLQCFNLKIDTEKEVGDSIETVIWFALQNITVPSFSTLVCFALGQWGEGKREKEDKRAL